MENKRGGDNQKNKLEWGAEAYDDQMILNTTKYNNNKTPENNENWMGKGEVSNKKGN